MHKFNLDIQGTYSFPVTYFGNKYPKKELKGNDNFKLFGALALIGYNNQDLLEEYGWTIDALISGASICDDALYLNDFEGFSISDRLTIKSLYLNDYDNVMAYVYDNKFDRFLEFVV